MTSETKSAVEKLQRIQLLWQQLGRTKASTPEYESLVEKIRVLSAEYEAFLRSHAKPEKD